MTTTTSTPGGYTSRFVAHVAHDQTTVHDEATSNSSNPLDRNRFRTFSADGTDERCSAGRVDADKVIAATATIAESAYDVDADRDAVKSQATDTSSAQTDIITDNSTTSSTSSHLAINEPENLLGGSRGDSPIVSVTSKDEDALVQGHSENDEISLAAAAGRNRDESTATDDSDTRRNDVKEVTPEKRDFEDVPSPFRIIVEDVDAFVAEGSNSTSQTVEMIDERGVRSRSKESHSVSECSSSVSGRTMSDSESESDSESDSEEEEEEDEEVDDESRDENCNVKNGKGEEKKKDDENYNDKDSTKSEANEENKNSSNSESDEETTVLSISSNTRGESSVTPDDHYERDLKRRSASIIDERSIEEMFDDNGWVVTEQDLEEDLQNDLRTVSVIPLDFESTIDRLSEEIADSIDDANDAAGTRTEEIIPRIVEGRHDEMSSNLEDSFARSSTVDDAEMAPSSERRGSEVPPRSHVYRQSSLGKNGWLVSDESESESDRTTSPIEAPSGRDVARIESASEATGTEESTGDIDENGWVILDNDDDDDDVDKEHVGDSSAQESTIRSQTTDLVNSKTNGALVANVATRSKGTEQSDPGEHEETPGASMSIPMQMVTTVFCVSVLCYSVLTNLFP